jgi:hypothetical protein
MVVELPSYVFRGDEFYRGGPLGLPLGSEEARTAQVQNPADHVLRKESGKESIFTSFTARVAIAERFGGKARAILKVEGVILSQLAADGAIKILSPEDVQQLLRSAGKKLTKYATATRDAMRRNAEILVEGQIPADVVQPAR